MSYSLGTYADVRGLLGMTTMSNILSIQKFIVSRSGIPLFEEVSLALNAGEACEILGRNGIGKTSFLEGVVGLSKETSGEVSTPSSLFYLSVKGPFDPEETVRNNLLFWAQFWKVSQNDFQQAVEFWHLKSLLNIPYEHLSQGQKQRMNLARISLKKAELWLLDEPLSYLDEKSSQVFKTFLKAHLNSGGMAIVAIHSPLNIGRQILLKPALGTEKRGVA